MFDRKEECLGKEVGAWSEGAMSMSPVTGSTSMPPILARTPDHSKPYARAVPVGAQFVPLSVVRSLNFSIVFGFFQILYEAVVKLLDDSHK